MKNQALVTTLAVLLAVSLSAVVALVVSSEVIGSSQTVIAVDPGGRTVGAIPEGSIPLIPFEEALDTEAVEATTAGLTTEEDAADADDTATDDDAAVDETDEAGDDADEADDAPTDTDPGPVGPGTSDSGDAPETGPAAPADPGDTDPGPVGPGTSDSGDAPETGPAAPADDDAADDDEPAPTEDDDDDEDEDDDGPSILCAPGYTLIFDNCIFTGCPFPTVLIGDVCTTLGETIPCPEGHSALPGGVCLPDFGGVFPGLGIFCPDGEHSVDGECVTVCPDGLTWINGLCLSVHIPEAEVNPDLLPDLDLDLSLFVPQVNPDLLPDLDLDLSLFVPQVDPGLLGN